MGESMEGKECGGEGKKKDFIFCFWELQKIFFFLLYFGPVIRLSWDWRVVRIHVWHGSTGP
jgi:hypothetical protein